MGASDRPLNAAFVLTVAYGLLNYLAARLLGERVRHLIGRVLAFL